MSNDVYKFGFDTTDPLNVAVTNMWEVEYKKGVERTKAEKIAGHTFDTVQNDAGVVVEVTDQFTTRKGFVETSIYSDPDANGLFVQTFEAEVAGPNTNVARLEQHKFTFDADGGVTQDLELSGKGFWRVDKIRLNETYQQEDIGGVDYVIKFEAERDGGAEFEVFKDGDNDGVWTQIAEGEANAGVDIVGMLTSHGLLEAAANIVG